ncbi:MAG: class F sortase [Patescibacteria group bacterium]
MSRTGITSIGVLTGAAIYTAIFFYISNITVQNTPALVIETAVPYVLKERAAQPVRLKIPSMQVNALVEHVGLTSDNAMDVPKNRANVAWFEPGWRPGENGNAIMAGHYGIRNRKPSVFDNLHKLRKGDKVYVEDEKGVTISFVVSKIRRYDSNADASSVFTSSDGKAHLNLITCEGVWDKTAESYSKRLVVFAELE